MKRILATLALACPLALPVAGLAAPPSAASVENLLEVSGAESSVSTMYTIMEDSMRAGVQQAVAGKDLTPQQQQAVDRIPARLMGVMREELAWTRLKPMFVQVYQETLTQEDVDGLVAFYRTPAGRAMIDKMPAVMQRSAAIMQDQMPPIIERLQAVMAEELRSVQVAP